MFIDCLDKARSTRGKVLMPDTIFRIDHGSQYTSNEFREMLRLSQFSQSMGSVGDSYDNAMAEALLRVIEEGARISNSLQHQRGGKNRDLRLRSNGTTGREDIQVLVTFHQLSLRTL